MTAETIRAELPPTGLEAPLSEVESTLQSNVRKFAQTVLRPVGARLDRLAPEEVIAPGSEYWSVFPEFARLGITIAETMAMTAEERGRLSPLLYEETGWGDGGLAISLGASSLPWLMMHALGNRAMLERYPEGSMIGCWGITEPDHGSDILDFGRMCAVPGSAYGRPNCVVKPDGGDLVIQGQKSAWVSNGPVAQLCVLYAAYDDGGPDLQHCVVLVPLDAKGVSRGKPLDKMGQRALPQGEIFFDGVRVPKDHLLAAPGPQYELAIYIILTEANAGMGAQWVGCARAAYEHALAYAHERKQGGVPIIRHQSVRHRLFPMFRKVEIARALSHRVYRYNSTAAVPALQGSIASKITSTQTAFDVASDAVQMLGGNGVTRAYPVEKLMRDARSSMIEDGCNEMLAIKGGTLLTDPALADAGIGREQIQAAYMGNAAASVITGQVLIPGEVVLRGMGIGRIPVVNVENACATSATAFQQAAAMVSAGVHDVVLVAGFEKLHSQDKKRTFSVFQGAVDIEDMQKLSETLARNARETGANIDPADAGSKTTARARPSRSTRPGWLTTKPTWGRRIWTWSSCTMRPPRRN